MKRGNFWLGLLLGVLLTGMVGTSTAAEWLQALPSTQTFFTNGEKVELEAYAINGHNYVKLRDVGKLVNFAVEYDGTSHSVFIDATKPYTEETPVTSEENSNYAQGVTASIFTESLTEEVYNALRESLLCSDAILDGTKERVLLPDDLDQQAVREVLAKISLYPYFEPVVDESGRYICDVRQPDTYRQAAQAAAPFLRSIQGLSQEEQITQIAYYVADHLTYAVKYPALDVIFSQDGQVEGCCMAYAYSVKLLCDLADLPCILVSSPSHQWNMVYVNGAWWDVDVTANDTGDDRNRSYWQILVNPSERYGNRYQDSLPEVTAFAKELLVPGSTK